MYDTNRFAGSAQQTDIPDRTQKQKIEPDRVKDPSGDPPDCSGTVQRSAPRCQGRVAKVGRRWFRTVPSSRVHLPISLEHAVRGKSAEFWLRLGEPIEALAELENVPHAARRNRWLHRLDSSARAAARAWEF